MAFTIRAAHVRDLKALREADLDGLGALVLIGGDNGVGKTGLLSILGGAVGFPWPDDILRDGAEKGIAEVELVDGDDTFKIAVTAWQVKARDTGEFTGEVSTKLVITKLLDDGTEAEVRKPRQWLKARLSGKHFDVLALKDELTTASGQRSLLERVRDAAGVDFAALDEEITAKRNERSGATAMCKRLTAARDAIPEDPACPMEMVDVSEVGNTLLALKRRDEDTRAAAVRVGITKEKIRVLQVSLAGDEAIVAATDLEATGAYIVETEARLASASAINQRVRQQADRREHIRELACEQGIETDANEVIVALEGEKAATLASADLGVPGLSISDDGGTLLYEGEPLSRLSDGQMIPVLFRLHAAQNPQIGTMFSTRASLLDDAHLALCDEIATELGMQCIFEIVQEREGALVIEATEDGSVLRKEA